MAAGRWVLVLALGVMTTVAVSATARAENYLSNPINIDGPIRAEGEAVSHANHYEPDPNGWYHNGGGFYGDYGSNVYDPYLDSYVTGSVSSAMLPGSNEAHTYANSSMGGLDENFEPMGGAGIETDLWVTVVEDPLMQPPGEATIDMVISALGDRTNGASAEATMTGRVGVLVDPGNPGPQNLKVLPGEGGPMVTLEITVNAPYSDYWELEIDTYEYTSNMVGDPWNFAVEVLIQVDTPYHFAFEYKDSFSINKVNEPEYYNNTGVVTLRVKEYVIPEPSTLVLLGMGALGLLACVSCRCRR